MAIPADQSLLAVTADIGVVSTNKSAHVPGFIPGSLAIIYSNYNLRAKQGFDKLIKYSIANNALLVIDHEKPLKGKELEMHKIYLDIKSEVENIALYNYELCELYKIPKGKAKAFLKNIIKYSGVTLKDVKLSANQSLPTIEIVVSTTALTKAEYFDMISKDETFEYLVYSEEELCFTRGSLTKIVESKWLASQAESESEGN